MGTKFTQFNKILQQPSKLKHIGNLNINLYTDYVVTSALDPEKPKPVNINWVVYKLLVYVPIDVYNIRGQNWMLTSHDLLPIMDNEHTLSSN